jgi:uncharacterized protein
MPWWPTFALLVVCSIAVLLVARWLKLGKRWWWGGFALASALAIYGMAIEPFRLVVTRWTVERPQWPADQLPLTIAVIADPHMGWPWMTVARYADIVARVNALKPDVILHLGDHTGTHPFMRQIAPADGLGPNTKLKAPCGVFAVLGNHDFDRRAPGWAQAARAQLPGMLENKAVPVDCKGMRFWVAGLADQWKQTPNLPGTLAQVDDAAPVLLLMHEPDLFPQVPPRVALTFAGHTHGGQIVLPFIGPLAVPSRFGTRYAYGPITENGRTLLVSGGLGMSILPIRFGRPPEITLVTLQGLSGR